MTDVLALASGPLWTDSDTPARIRLTGGGAGANTAAWLAELGAAVTFVCAVGDDDTGRARTSELRSVDVAALTTAEPTGTVVVLVRPDGGRSMLPDRGANDRLTAEHVTSALAACTPAHVHVSGYTLLGAGSRAAGLAALAWAYERGIECSASLASAAPLVATGAAAVREWLTRTDVVLANHDEALVVTGESDPSRAASSLAEGRFAAIVTLGSQGALWADRDGVVRRVAQPAAVVDTTGAGDAFTAGLLAAILRKVSGAEALDAGSAAAARCVSHPGARPSR
ncbi:sugar kinase [Fodinicola feengrottensis]|uniref:Sugar kinase n=1 Tax=Fodinicola feengrottensis TaxID=435914 RepID=A0ABP4V7R2_9ACTN